MSRKRPKSMKRFFHCSNLTDGSSISNTSHLQRSFNVDLFEHHYTSDGRYAIEKTKWRQHEPRNRSLKIYTNRPDKAANILAPVEMQCDWLREIGYEEVDCYFRVYELAVFGGRKPKQCNR